MPKRGLRGVALIALVVCMLMPKIALAERKVLRVGWFPCAGYQATGEDGSHAGYIEEYLRRLAQRTGWRYVFVEADWNECLQMLAAGEIDLMGCMYDTPARREAFDFSALDIGVTYSSLFVAAGSSAAYEDFAAFDGMTIAVCENAKVEDSLRLFLSEHGAQARFTRCASQDAVVSAVLSGQADAGALSGYIPFEGTRIVARFAPEPFYFATTKGNAAVLRPLDRALADISLEDPYWQETLSEKYLQSPRDELVLTDDERMFVESSGDVRVLYSDAWIPLETRDAQSGEFTGIVAEVFQLIAARTGLRFSFLHLADAREMYETLKEGAADVIAGVENNPVTATVHDLQTSNTYISLPLVLLSNPAALKAGNEWTAGVDYLYSYEGLKDEYNFRFYDTVEECFEVVRRGEASRAIVNSCSANYLIAQNRYADLQLVNLQGWQLDLCAGVRFDADPALLSLINKAIATIGDGEMNDIVIRNTIDSQETGWIAALNRLPVTVVLPFSVGLLLAVVALGVILILRARGSRLIKRLLYNDTLTGLYNQSGFEKAARQALDRAPPEQFLAIMVLDINAFEMYNALYGFAAGDKLLCAVAGVLKKQCAEGEMCARMSADQFVMLLIGGDMDLALRRAEDVGRAVCALNAERGALLANLGLYEVRNRALNVATMYDHATMAKRTIKTGYERRVAVYTEAMHTRQVEDAELLAGLDAALQNREFLAYYQPKYDVRTETVVGAEALVRWRRADGRMIPPDRFIGLLEKNGLISRLDWYMLERVCENLAQMRGEGKPVVPVSINFSRAHLYEYAFADRLAETARRYGLPGELLEVELTESAFLARADMLIDLMKQLHARGFLVSIDDFGSGYSSLNMLKDMPADVLKIDMKFLQGFEKGGRVGTVVTAIMRLAKWLDIPVVAEGIETAAQVDFLRSVGCDEIQGYYFARPMPFDDFVAHLARAGTGAPARKRQEPLEDVGILLGGNQLVTRLIESVFGGLGLYELVEGRLEAIRVNDGYFEMFGYDAQSFGRDSKDVLAQVVPEDRPLAEGVCREALLTGRPVRAVLRRRHRDGHALCLDTICRHLGGTEERPVLCITFVDVTDRRE